MPASAHRQRLITGAALIILLACGLAAGGLVLRLMALAAALLGLWEFFQLFWPGRAAAPRKAAGLMLGAAVILAAGSPRAPELVLGILGLGGLLAALLFLYRQARGAVNGAKADPAEGLPLLFGLLYIPLPLHLALTLGLEEQILAILITAASDAGAYYAGSNFGRHKLCPAVSPNKSLEGAAGGLLAAAAVAALFSLLLPPPGFAGAPWAFWPALGLILSCMAQLGDLFESALKRAAGVKDSGRLLPGHGGALDRLDSLLFVLAAWVGLKALLLGCFQGF